MKFDTLIVVSEEDPVAQAVGARWGTPPASGYSVDGTPVRVLGPAVGLLRRPGLHIRDEHLDRALPPDIVLARPTIIFPSIHRSERGDRSLTVHPLGNLGPSAEVGGSPNRVVPSDPRRMTDTLRRLAEGGARVGLPATFEGTHHGPDLALPAFFAEIGYADDPAPPAAAVALLAEVLPQVAPDASDHVVIGVGGGHYVPHFTDLALKRRWAFGHLVSRHRLETMDLAVAHALGPATPDAEGVVFARAADATTPIGSAIGRRISEGAAPRRDGRPAD